MKNKSIFKQSLFRRIICITLCAMLLCTLFGCDEGSVVNGNLVIELDGNPTTGYTWVYEMSEEGIIEEVSNVYTPISTSDALVGIGGTFRFEFRAVSPGEVGLQFSYLRTFQENSVISTRTYAVTVDDKLNITLYDVDGDVSGSDIVTDDSGDKIVAGKTFIDTVVFGETTEDIVFTWTLCNSGFYIGVDTEYIQWYCENGLDYFVPVYPSSEDDLIGTSMVAQRYRDTGLSAKDYADKLMSSDSILTDFSEFTAEIDSLPAVGVFASNPDMGISANYYFVDVDGDVVEIAIFYEGENADAIGPILDVMALSITFNDNIGIFE